MKRMLIALIPWMVLATSAAAIQSRSAEVVFTYLGVIPERAVRVADECYVPVEFLTKLGWKHSVRNTSVIIETEHKGARVPLREFELGRMVPLRSALDQMGLESLWEPDSDKLLVCTPVTKVVVSKNEVSVHTLLPTRPRVYRMTGPHRFVVDLPGTRLTRETIQEIDAKTVRVGQVEMNTVRIAYEPGYRPSLPVIPGIDNNFRFELDPDDDPGTPDTPVEPPPVVEPKVNNVRPPTPGLGAKVVAGPLRLDVESANRAVLSLKLSGLLKKPAQFRRPEPSTLEIVLYNADIKLPESGGIQSGSITDVSVRQDGDYSILSLKLSRPMGVELAPNSGSLIISLIKPNVGNGHLAGKVVVVDAGHGGTDSGAKSPAKDAFEKTLTLKIAKELAERLAKEGATVIMTRKTDVFIELKERAMIANRNQADFFISCHINSSAKANGTSGGMTFYHKNSPIGQVLAECIQSEIAKVSGLKSHGAWSDGRIYQSGFAVLRHSTMPGVLIEFGFINNNFDRKRMVTTQFQESVAAAVVKGLKVYLGDGN